MKLLDPVILKEDIPYEELKEKLWLHDEVPKEGMKKGTKGTIVEVFIVPTPAFEVEFFDEQGKEIGLICLEPHQIEPRS